MTPILFRALKITCKPIASCIIARMTPSSAKGIPNHFSSGRTNNIATRSRTKTHIANKTTWAFVMKSRATAANIITAAIPYGVTIVGNASGLTAHVGENGCLTVSSISGESN